MDEELELMSAPVTLDEITGTLGEWFERDISGIPDATIECLRYAYDQCAELL